MYKKIGFIGLGLIGGSIAKIIKENNTNTEIIALTSSEETIKKAYNDGIINNSTTISLNDFNDIDLLLLCSPVGINVKYLRKLKPILNKKTIISDVGSVKCDIHNAINELGLQERFIGGHPMCGSEKIGYENSSIKLFENAYYIITNNQNVSNHSILEFKDFISKLGAIPLEMTVKEHDYITAGISHLPHVISASLVNLIMNNDTSSKGMKQIAAGGFRDITRISSSSPKMWQHICKTNKEEILNLFELYNIEINKFKNAMLNDDYDEILELFSNAKEYRDSLEIKNGFNGNIYELYCDLVDEAGGIATLATILAKNNINIKNIGIINNREFQDGVLRIELYDEYSLNKAISLLETNNYNVYKRNY